MNINLLAKLTLLGLAYIYTTKLIDTFYHGIFTPVSLAGIVVGLNILAGLAQLLFFIALFQQVVPQDKQVLRSAASLAIIGSALGLLPKFLAMALLFQHQSLSFLIRNAEYVRAFGPWLAVVLLLAFSLIFICDYRFVNGKSLKYGFTAGAIGWFIMAVAQSLAVINYLAAGRLVWLTDLFALGPLVFVTASTITFLSLSIFYMTFIRYRPKEY